MPQLGQRQRWTKDILSCGVWDNSWPEPWDVTPEVLDTIVAGFQLAQTAGYETPVVMIDESAVDSDGSANQHIDIAKFKIGEVTALRREGDRLIADLWTASEINPEVYQLDTKNQKVSVDVRPWVDGKNNQYPLRLKHLAIVVHPIVGGQGPFVRQLSQIQPGAKQMAKEKQLAEGDGVDTNSWNFDEVKELLGKFGITLPDSATTKEAVMAVADALSGAGQAEEETPEEMPMDAAANLAANPAGANPLQLSTALRTLGKGYKLATTQLAQNEAAAKAVAKSNFETALTGHVSRGAITEAERQAAIAAGASHGYQLATIQYMDRIPANAALPVGQGKARQLATNAPPRTGAESARPTDEECKATAERLRKRQFSGVR